MADPASLVDDLFADEARYGTTYAALVVQHDRPLAERYGGALPHFDGPDEPVGPDTKLLSWSVAKSVLHAAVGVLVGEQHLDLDAPVRVPEWSAPGDPRREITLEHMLCMRDGLDFVEDYVDAGRSDVIEMLFGAGQDDVAHFAASRPLAHAPGTIFNYSSGTSNIVARLVGSVVGRGGATLEFLRDAVFDPIGMESATARVDTAGTFIGSSYVYATARDWLRFGQCYLHDGVCGGRRVIPEGWVAHGRRARSVDPDDGRRYGAHWWVLTRGDDSAATAGERSVESTHEHRDDSAATVGERSVESTHEHRDDSAATVGERSVESTHEHRDDSAATAGERSVESTHEHRDDSAATAGERSVESTRSNPDDAFYASGYEGQRIVVCPNRGLVIARFGRSSPNHYDALADWCRAVVAACAPPDTVQA